MIIYNLEEQKEFIKNNYDIDTEWFFDLVETGVYKFNIETDGDYHQYSLDDTARQKYHFTTEFEMLLNALSNDLIHSKELH